MLIQYVDMRMKIRYKHMFKHKIKKKNTKKYIINNYLCFDTSSALLRGS